MDIGVWMRITKFYKVSGYDDDKHQEKTIMVLGATGTGKSTMVDAVFNHIAGVSLVDDHRFTIVNLTDAEKVKSNQQVMHFCAFAKDIL